MAKGQHLTRHQKGIVKRYYENKDTIATQKLGELVSELYLTESPKKAEQLWKQVHTALINAGANKAQLEKICEEKNLQKLADLVNKLC